MAINIQFSIAAATQLRPTGVSYRVFEIDTLVLLLLLLLLLLLSCFAAGGHGRPEKAWLALLGHSTAAGSAAPCGWVQGREAGPSCLAAGACRHQEPCAQAAGERAGCLLWLNFPGALCCNRVTINSAQHMHLQHWFGASAAQLLHHAVRRGCCFTGMVCGADIAESKYGALSEVHTTAVWQPHLNRHMDHLLMMRCSCVAAAAGHRDRCCQAALGPDL
jgi:hypothetical protein